MTMFLAIALAAAQMPATTLDPYDQAVAARRSGENAEAVIILAQLVRDHPENADAWVQYGYALRATGHPAEAGHAFRRALALAPSYQDASDGLGLLVADERASPRFQLDIDGGYATVGAGQPDWREGTAQLRYQPTQRVATIGRIEASRRFSKTDIYGEARVDLHPVDAIRIYALAGGTPSADYRPKVQVAIGGSARLSGGPAPTVATAEVRWARYPTGNVWTVSPGIEQYLAGGRLWLTGRWINVIQDGRHLGGWLARADVQASNRLRLFAGAARAPDLEQGVAIKTRSLFGGAVVDLDDNHLVRLTIANDRPDVGPERTQVNVGFGIRFR